MWVVFLASTVSLAEIPLPSYRDDLALTSWYEVNDRIEDACLRDRETQQCVGWDGEILDDAIAMAESGDVIAIDNNGIKDVFDMGDGRVKWHHARMNPLLDPFSGPARNAKQFNAVAQIISKLDIKW